MSPRASSVRSSAPQNAKGADYEIAFEPGAPSWGPDSNTIALAVQQSYSTRFREGASEILTVNATTGETHEYDPYPTRRSPTAWKATARCGPDGKYMAYVLDDVLWILPVTPTGAPAGPPRQLTNEVADQLSWSGDSQHLLYDSAERCEWSRWTAAHPPRFRCGSTGAHRQRRRVRR